MARPDAPQEAQEDEEWGAELYETQQAHQGSDAVAWESRTVRDQHIISI